jgi:hypothetical protein
MIPSTPKKRTTIAAITNIKTTKTMYCERAITGVVSALKIVVSIML